MELGFDAHIGYDGEVFKIGAVQFQLIHTPGHTPACVTYVIGDAAFVGDTRVKTTIDPTIPPDETPYPPTDPTLVVGPPQCTSCSL